MATRRIFRFAGSVRMRGLGNLIMGNLTNITDYGAVSGTASTWPDVLVSGSSDHSRSGAGAGITGLVNQDRTLVDNMDYGKGTYGLNSSKPTNSQDYGSVA